MGPLLRQPAGQVGGTFAAIETGLGFGQKSRSIKDLERIRREILGALDPQCG